MGPAENLTVGIRAKAIFCMRLTSRCWGSAGTKTMRIILRSSPWNRIMWLRSILGIFFFFEEIGNRSSQRVNCITIKRLSIIWAGRRTARSIFARSAMTARRWFGIWPIWPPRLLHPCWSIVPKGKSPIWPGVCRRQTGLGSVLIKWSRSWECINFFDWSHWGFVFRSLFV